MTGVRGAEGEKKKTKEKKKEEKKKKKKKEEEERLKSIRRGNEWGCSWQPIGPQQ